jgi:adenine-specific DNA-methyltransferase
MSENDQNIYDQEDQYGRYLIRPLRKTGGEDKRSDRPSMYYPVMDPDGNKVFPIGPGGYESRWRCGNSTYEQLLRDHRIEWKKRVEENKEVWKPYQKFYVEGRTKQTSNLWFDIAGNKKASLEIKSIFSEKVFDFPKPVDLIVKCLAIVSESNDIILDFFSGSATTAHAVLAQNQADGGNRRFILVQLPEATDNRQYPTIAEIGKERIRRVIAQLRNSATPPAAAATAQTALALTPSESPHLPAAQASDLGFKVFKLAPSVFRDWQDYEGSDPNALRDLFSQAETPLRAGWQAAEVLAEVMLLEGFPLDSLCRPAAAFTHNTVFCVQSEVCQHRLFVCLETQLHPATLQQLAELRRDVFICLDSALSDQAKVRLQDLVTLKVI